ncbi:avidin/streptavidin family protein [Kitasatospora sp. NPDC096140]|uniref:avidin/streptavidin family protein n=1 Tax=unclassified Kitasatospora TaxID=2633591 RepID=UPI00331AD6AF
MVDGEWFNELGSCLDLATDGAGALSGTFAPGVGPAGKRELVGRYDPSPAGAGVALGWTVTWSSGQGEDASVTSWSGQYLPEEERIVAHWLFTTASGARDAWRATAVGQDVFGRRLPDNPG